MIKLHLNITQTMHTVYQAGKWWMFPIFNKNILSCGYDQLQLALRYELWEMKDKSALDFRLMMTIESVTGEVKDF